MADVAQLRRQIQELKDQQQRTVEELKRQQETLRCQYERDAQELKSRLDNAVVRMDQNYIRQVRQLTEELTARQRRFQTELQKASQAARRREKEILEELQAENRQLQAELSAIRERENRAAQAGQMVADQYCRQAEDLAAEVDRLPHRFFMPGKLDIYREHLDGARQWAEQGMYEAAAAAADAVLTELETFQIDLWEQQRQWEEIYETYRLIAVRIRDKLDRFEQASLRTPCGVCQMSRREQDYWSGGAYSAVCAEADRFWELVRGVESAGSVEAWLSAFTGEKGVRFQRKIQELHRLEERVDAVTECIRAERYYSDERWQMSQDVQPMLEEIGFFITQSGFRDRKRENTEKQAEAGPEARTERERGTKPESGHGTEPEAGTEAGTERGTETGTPPEAEPSLEAEEELEEDPLDCYDVEATPNGQDMVALTFIPVRKDGVVVRNLCAVSTNIHTLPNPAQTERLVHDTIAGVRPSLPESVRIQWCQDREILPSVEREQKKRPDSGALARRLERKYQS